MFPFLRPFNKVYEAEHPCRQLDRALAVGRLDKASRRLARVQKLLGDHPVIRELKALVESRQTGKGNT